MKRRSRNLVALAVALAVALCAGSIPGLAAPASSAARSTNASDSPAHHVVYAGNLYDEDAGGPVTNSDRPFVHTTFSPQRLEAHPGDTVEWRFSAGYGGWHTVSFAPEGRSDLWRADEIPGTIGITGSFLHGHENGFPADQCGRTDWHGMSQDACVLNAEAIAAGFSSSLVDRFFSTSDAGSFVTTIDPGLAPGTYSYFCKYHVTMNGTIAVLPASTAVRNPSFDEIRRQHEADEASAEQFVDELRANAYNPVTKEWTVHAGSLTDDGRIAVLNYIPSDITVRKGDRVTFVAGGAEPHTASFPREKALPGDWKEPAPDPVDLQGGFSTDGSCDVDNCTGSVLAPRGLVGLAYPWMCEYDELDGGAPGVLASYVFANVEPATPGDTTGCPSIGTKQGRLEFVAGAYMAQGQSAPLGFVATEATVHNSGILMDASAPEGFRLKPDGDEFPSTFEARFPSAGEFTFGCYAHEIMKGRIRVS